MRFSLLHKHLREGKLHNPGCMKRAFWPGGAQRKAQAIEAEEAAARERAA